VVPTWHISAASIALHDLGVPVDIVVSSVDFLFPHLENVREIGEALTGKPFAGVWMVCERIWSGKDERTSDEPDANIPVRTLTNAGISPNQLRYWLLCTHYRKPIHFTQANIRNTLSGYARLKEFVRRVRHIRGGHQEHKALGELLYALEQNFFDAMADDLNAPKALAALFRFTRTANPILDSGEFSEPQRLQILEILQRLNAILGILDLDFEDLSSEEEELLRARAEARNAKEWAQADRLREELLRRGLQVVDTPAGTRWRRI